MNITLDCLPCFVRHTVEVLREFTADEQLQKDTVKEVLRMVAGLDFDQTPPEFAAEVHTLLRQKLGVADPYLQIKKDSNALAERLYPALADRVAAAADPLRIALMYAISGNIIDSGVSARTSEAEVLRSIEMAENIVPAVNHYPQLVARLQSAKRVLILGDNAGEIVFDRLFLNCLNGREIVYAVKGAPILNDALREDAQAAGIEKLATIVDTGAAIPGVAMSRSSQAFKDAYGAADVIVAKGQANYETLSEARDPRIFFALRAKCSVIAAKVGVPQGSFLILNPCL